VRGSLAKVGGGGGNFEVLQDMQFAFCVFHPEVGLPAKYNSSEILIGSFCCLRWRNSLIGRLLL
jgi:hypothetical protein